MVRVLFIGTSRRETSQYLPWRKLSRALWALFTVFTQESFYHRYLGILRGGSGGSHHGKALHPARSATAREPQRPENLEQGVYLGHGTLSLQVGMPLRFVCGCAMPCNLRAARAHEGLHREANLELEEDFQHRDWGTLLP